MNKDVKQLATTLSKIEGVELRPQANGHQKVYFHNEFATTLPATPSDSHWRENTLADLRRAGVFESNPKTPLTPVAELRSRIGAMKNRSAFARFVVDEMPKLHKNLRTYKSFDSASASLNQLVHARFGITHWVHELLDSALREWDARGGEDLEAWLGQPENAIESHDEPEVEPTRSIPVSIGAASVTVEHVESTMVELASDYEILTSQIDELASKISTLRVEYDKLVAKREWASEQMISRLTEPEVKP